VAGPAEAHPSRPGEAYFVKPNDGSLAVIFPIRWGFRVLWFSLRLLPNDGSLAVIFPIRWGFRVLGLKGPKTLKPLRNDGSLAVIFPIRRGFRGRGGGGGGFQAAWEFPPRQAPRPTPRKRTRLPPCHRFVSQGEV
jgi:hypothetical protein